MTVWNTQERKFCPKRVSLFLSSGFFLEPRQNKFDLDI